MQRRRSLRGAMMAPHPSIFAGGHLFDFLIAVGREIFRVGVELVEHKENGILYVLLGVDRVNVIEVEVAVETVENIKLLGRLEVVAALRLHRGRGQSHHQQQTPGR